MELTVMATRESELAKAMGLTRKAMSDLRFSLLRFQIDWYREDTKAPEAKRPVWITPEGIIKLSEHWGVKSVQVEAETKKLSAANAAEVSECTVISVFPRNPRLVQVLLNGQQRMMRVRDNAKWTRGMKVETRTEGGMSNFLIPLRNPRFKGRF
jgi:hypothetical protein